MAEDRSERHPMEFNAGELLFIGTRSFIMSTDTTDDGRKRRRIGTVSVSHTEYLGRRRSRSSSSLLSTGQNEVNGVGQRGRIGNC